ncbi:MAG: hypothetical protein ABH952_09165 [Candidatus Omnitrophota bacterium]
MKNMKKYNYIIKKDFFTPFGYAFRVINHIGKLIYYSRQKPFKLKEEIRIYNNLEMIKEEFWIKARQILDWYATYDIIDSKSQEIIGSLKRVGNKEHVFRELRDCWEILDKNGAQIGEVIEDKKYFMRRLPIPLIGPLLGVLIPQNYTIEINKSNVGTINQIFNPFIHKFKVYLNPEKESSIDKRIIIAGTLLLLAIEGRQKQ